MHEFPDFIKLPLDTWIDDAIKWLTVAGDAVFSLIRDVLLVPLQLLEAILLWLPWFVVIMILAAIGWRLSGWRLAVGIVIGMFFIGVLGLWEHAMKTLAIVIAATLTTLFIGVPVGIAMSRNDWVKRFVQPVLDTMQTMPSFVYLIPALMLFGLGKVPALLATFIYAVPPVIRLTDLGIRQVPEDVVEASQAFGSTDWQLLSKVQLPLAMPSIMLGVNQCIMMALAMVVIASMIGAGGLGNEVLIGLSQLKVGRGFNGGISIVILAIIIDRITQKLAKTT